MSEIPYIEQISSVIDAYSNATQTKIIHLLRVYGRLSTSEVAEKLNKAKSTVLRYLDHLVDTGLVAEEQVQEGRGRYPTRYYSFVRENLVGLDGSKLRNEPIQREDFETYLRAFQSQYILIKDIMEQAETYLERMIAELRQMETKKEFFRLGKDNLGEVHLGYLTKAKVWSRNEDLDIEGVDDTLQEYLKIQLVLPIRRLIETIQDDTWTFDGTLWSYPEDERELSSL